MELGLKGKTGLVTGASEGIGMDAVPIPAGLPSLAGCENVVVDGSKSLVI